MSKEYLSLFYIPVRDEKTKKEKKYWAGVNQYYVQMKKKHNIIKSYEYYWFVYGKEGYIYFFVFPNSDYGVRQYLLRDMKYMTHNDQKISLWNDKKKFSIKFSKKEDKQFFDKYYIKCINRETDLSFETI